MSQKIRPATLSAPESVLQTPLHADDLDAALVQKIEDTIAYLLTLGETTASGTAATPATVATAAVTDKPEPGKTAREMATKKWLKETFKLPRLWHSAGQLSGWTLWLSAIWAIIAFIVALAGEHGWMPFVTPLLITAAGWLGVTLIDKKQKQWKQGRTFSPQTLAQVLPLLPRDNAMEAAYVDALLALFKQQAAWGAGATQNVLQDLKTLLQTGKQTTARRAEIQQAMSHQSVQALETELGRLADRAAGTTDASARDTFKQSLILLEARLTRAKSLEPLRQQLEAQEEVITQALAEAQSALSGASLGHWAFAPSNETVAPLPLAHLGDTVSQLRRQTEAVEQAVQEVVGRRGA